MAMQQARAEQLQNADSIEDEENLGPQPLSRLEVTTLNYDKI